MLLAIFLGSAAVIAVAALVLLLYVLGIAGLVALQ